MLILDSGQADPAPTVPTWGTFLISPNKCLWFWVHIVMKYNLPVNNHILSNGYCDDGGCLDCTVS